MCRSDIILYTNERRNSGHIAVVYTHKCRLRVVSYFKGIVILIVEKPTVKCSIAIKAPFLYPILYPSVTLDYLSWRVPLVEQELLNFLGHLTSPPVFSRVRVTRCLVLCMFCRSLFVPLYFFLLAIALCVLLRYMDAYYLIDLNQYRLSLYYTD